MVGLVEGGRRGTGMGMGEDVDVVRLWGRRVGDEGREKRESEGSERVRDSADRESWRLDGFGYERNRSDVELRAAGRDGRS